MRPYEVMVILDAGLEDDAIRASIDRAIELGPLRGRHSGVDRWGKRRFAYELHHKWEGYYVLLDVTGEPAALAEVDRSCPSQMMARRHKVIRLPEKVAGRQRPAPAAP